MIKTDADDKTGLKMVNPGAAALDIGSTMHMAAVNPHSDDMPSARPALSRKTCMNWLSGSSLAA